MVLAWYCISRVVYLLFSNYYLSWNELVFFLFISFNSKEILDFLLFLLCVSITWHQSTKNKKNKKLNKNKNYFMSNYKLSPMVIMSFLFSDPSIGYHICFIWFVYVFFYLVVACWLFIMTSERDNSLQSISVKLNEKNIIIRVTWL